MTVPADIPAGEDLPVATPVEGPAKAAPPRKPAGETLEELHRELPKSVAEVRRLPLPPLLILAGATAAAGLGVLQFLLEVVISLATVDPGRFTWGALRLLLDLILAGLLVLAYVRGKADVRTGWVMAGLTSILLLVFGWWAGTVAGILALIGALLWFLESENAIGPRGPPATALPVATAVPVAAPGSSASATAPVPAGPEIVEDVFLVHKDGRLLAQESRRLKPAGHDDLIMTGMLTAISSFVKGAIDVDEGAAERELGEITYGEFTIVLEHGTSMFIAAVMHRAAGATFREKMRRAVQRIEAEYGSAIREWDGDPESLKGVGAVLRKELFG